MDENVEFRFHCELALKSIYKCKRDKGFKITDGVQFQGSGDG